MGERTHFTMQTVIKLKRIVFTYHALERMKQFGLSKKKFFESLEFIMEDNIKKKDDKKNIKHYRFGPYIFTFALEKDVSVLITMFDQRLRLKDYAEN